MHVMSGHKCGRQEGEQGVAMSHIHSAESTSSNGATTSSGGAEDCGLVIETMDPTSINTDGERRDSRAALVKKYEDAELSSASDYNLMDLPIEAADRPGALGVWLGETGRSSGRGPRQALPRRDFVLKMVAHTLAGFTGEFVGTCLLTLCIISAVASSVIAGALSGLWQVAVVSGLGVALSIYLSGHISDAHLNPAVTVAFAVLRFRQFSWKKIAVYIVAQMLGGFAAGAVLYGTYHNAIEAFEVERGIERGANGSELSAMVFGEYFPNPALFPGDTGIISPVAALFIEAWATGILVFVIFALTDPRNTTVGSGKHKVPVPILIGATVMILISLYGPLTQAGLNPARDFGPRAFAALAGWGDVAIPGPRCGFWVYIVGPLVGGVAGGALYDLGAAKAMQFKMQIKSNRQSHEPGHRIG